MKIKKYLQQSPVIAINTAYEAIIPKLNKQLKSDNLNLIQGLVLTALFFEESGEVKPSQLADIFRTSRSHISHILSDLEYKGFIRRIVNSQDARSFQIELKAEGKKRALLLIKFYDRLQSQFEKDLGLSYCQKTVKGIFTLVDSFKRDL